MQKKRRHAWWERRRKWSSRYNSAHLLPTRSERSYICVAHRRSDSQREERDVCMMCLCALFYFAFPMCGERKKNRRESYSYSYTWLRLSWWEERRARARAPRTQGRSATHAPLALSLNASLQCMFGGCFWRRALLARQNSIKYYKAFFSCFPIEVLFFFAFLFCVIFFLKLFSLVEIQ